MTLTAETCAVTRSWTGAETQFDTGFKVQNAAHVTVSIGGMPLTRGTHYTSRRETTGILTVIPLAAMPAAPQTLLIERATPATQLDDLVNGDTFDMEALEASLDKAYSCIQEERRLMRDPLRGSGSTGDLVVRGSDGRLSTIPIPTGLSDASYLRRDGAMPMTGPLVLAGDATLPLHAVPKQQVDAALAALQSRPFGEHISTTFPLREGTAGVRKFYDPETDEHGSIHAHYSLTVASVEVRLRTGPGQFNTSVVDQALDIKTPYGIDTIIFNDKLWLAVTSYADPALSGSDTYYDQKSRIYRRDAGVFVLAYEEDSYGGVSPKFDIINGTLSCSFANSVSSTRNTAGGVPYDNCTRQSISIVDYDGSNWAQVDEVMNTTGAYQGPQFYWGGVRYLIVAGYYDDGGVAPGSGGRRYAPYLLILPMVGGHYTVTNWAWRIASRSLSSVAVFIRENRCIICPAQQRGDANYGDDDIPHFRTNAHYIELLANGEFRKIKARKNFNCNMVRAIPIGDRMAILWCNTSSGGLYPTNFTAGVIAIDIWDDRTFRPMSLRMVPAKGVYDVDLYLDGLEWILMTAEFGEGDSGTYTYEVESRALNLGQMVVDGPEEQTEDMLRPISIRNRLVNPDFAVTQRGTGAVTTNGAYAADMWKLLLSNVGTTAPQAQVTNVLSPNGSTNRLVLSIGGTGSVADDTIIAVHQRLEAARVADFKYGGTAAEDVILQVGVRSSHAGTFPVVLRNAALDRAFVGTYTIGAGDVNADLIFQWWIEGITDGTWPTLRNAWGELVLGMAAGADYRVTQRGWHSGTSPYVLTTSACTNLAVNGQSLQFFDVGLWLDSDKFGDVPKWEAPDYGQNLQDCRQYYQKFSQRIIPTANIITGRLTPAMRATPTLAHDGGSTGTLTALSADAFYQDTGHGSNATVTVTADAQP